MAATKYRILDKIKQLGNNYYCFHCEIPPYGPGTRRYMLGKIKTPINKPKLDHGEQEYLIDPLPAAEFEKELDKLLTDFHTFSLEIDKKIKKRTQGHR